MNFNFFENNYLKVFSKHIFYFAIYKVLAYYALPLVLGIFSNHIYVRLDKVDLLDYLYLYQIDKRNKMGNVMDLNRIALHHI